MRDVLLIPGELLAADVIQEHVVNGSKFLRTAMRKMSPPDNFILKIILSENLVQHHLDVARSVPITLIVETDSFLENSGQLHASGAHELDIGLPRFVAILE